MGVKKTGNPRSKERSPRTRVSKADVRLAIMGEERRWRERYKLLQHQNAIGAAIIIASLVLNLGLAVGYALAIVPAAVAVLGIAFGLSLLHEIEHDLIHNLYFAGHKKLQNFVFRLIWVVKLHANPIWRRKVHLRHHAKSGQIGDWEERLLGLGDHVIWRRLVAILIPFGSHLYFGPVASTDPEFSRTETFKSNLPAGATFVILALLGILHLVLPASVHVRAPEAFWSAVVWLNVVWLLPGIVRHTAITLMTTSVHYAGDIPAGDVRYENQIVDHWLYLPLQLFCFNFGATHVIHHYVAAQPFYLRQMVSAKVKPVLLAAGVRHNDLKILQRANRWHYHREDANAA